MALIFRLYKEKDCAKLSEAWMLLEYTVEYTVAYLLVHVYFNILWENRYKKSYALIFDEFIARVAQDCL
jgi:IS4 transposase